MKLLNTVSILSLATFIHGDWQFRSRPDLSPPKLNITIDATEETDNGYLFIAPFSGFKEGGPSHGPRQSAPYIFTDKGELVWSGFGIFSGWPANFQKGVINGEDVLFALEGTHNPDYGHGHGHWTFLNKHYDQVGILRAGNHKISDKHELHIVNGKTALLQVYQPVPRDLSAFGGKKNQQWVVDSIFQELDIETGEVLFEWSSLDHVSPADSVLPVNPGHAGSGFNSSDAWDYFHINSVDKDEKGDYVISARNAASLYKIDGKTGEIIWKLGGLPDITSSDFEYQNWNFSFQHHARFLPRNGEKEIISFFDNSAQGTEDANGGEVHYNSHSSGKIVELNSKTKKAKLLYNAIPPDNLLAKSQGSTQVLENGNVLVNWGSEGAVTEFNENGKPIFHAYLDSGKLFEQVENYRAFKYDWTGQPSEKIAVVTEITNDDKSIVYVSWNGDTETKSWEFYAIESNGKQKFLGEKERSGFETSIELDGKYEKIIVVSRGSNGKTLGTSDISKVYEQVLPANDEGENSNFNYFKWKSLFQTIFF